MRLFIHLQSLLNKIKKYKYIILVLLSISLPIMLNNTITLDYKIKMYTLANLIKNILIVILPFLIFPFITRSFIQMKTSGTYLVCFILLMVLLSNFTTLMLSYGIANTFIPYLTTYSATAIQQPEESIKSLFFFDFPEIVSIPQVMVAGITSGIILGYKPFKYTKKFIDIYYNCSRTFFEKYFINILPFYILGGMFKIAHESDFLTILSLFGNVMILIIGTTIFYIGGLFLFTQNGNVITALQAIKNALPAGLTGFSTMSSLITMPITIKAAEKNTSNPQLASLTISTSVNSHDIGDGISLSIIALSIIYMEMRSLPSFDSYIYFAIILSLSQFSGISVPGGSLAVMLPLLITHFNFTNEMSSILITLSIFIEPLGTAGNVMGNSAFAILIDKIYNKFNSKKRSLYRKYSNSRFSL